MHTRPAYLGRGILCEWAAGLKPTPTVFLSLSVSDYGHPLRLASLAASPFC